MAESIKTYPALIEHANADAPPLDLEIKLMSELHEKFKGIPDTPHRHDYFTIIWPTKAKGKHIVDFVEYELEPNAIFFISPWQVHQLISTEKPEGYVITFSCDFLNKSKIREEFISDLHLFNEFGKTPPLKMNDEIVANLKQLVQQMIAFKKGTAQFKNDSLGALLKLFLIYCHSSCDAANITDARPEDTGTYNIRQFRHLLNEHYSKEHSVNFYADGINITADHLNRVVKSYTGITAKEFIDDKVILEAKRMVMFSDLNSKEIAYEMGFAKPSNFSNFFKKHTGLNVTEFKSKNQI